MPVSGRHPAHLQNTNGPGPFPQPLPILETNLFELRLNFQWPLIVGAGGDYRGQTRFAKSLTFRTLVSGQQLTRSNDQTGEVLYFMAPRQYSYSTSQLTNPPPPNPQPYSP